MDRYSTVAVSGSATDRSLIQSVGLHALPAGCRVGYVERTARHQLTPSSIRPPRVAATPGCVRLVTRSIRGGVRSVCFGCKRTWWAVPTARPLPRIGFCDDGGQVAADAGHGVPHHDSRIHTKAEQRGDGQPHRVLVCMRCASSRRGCCVLCGDGTDWIWICTRGTSWDHSLLRPKP
jgi:hypothetical protein